MRPLVLAAIVAALFVSGLSGCAGHVESSATSATSATSAGPTASPSVSATPPATAAAIARTGLTPPTPIFDGDCSNLFTDDEMTTIAGTPMGQYSYDDDGPGDPVYRQLGILSCTWLAKNRTDSISMTVLRNELAPEVPVQDCGLFTSGEVSGFHNICVFDAVSHGVRISGAVYWPKRAQSRAIDVRLLAKFRAADHSAAADRVPAVAAGSWPVVVSCDAIPTIPVDGKTVKLATDILGSDAGTTPLADALAGGNSHSGGCFGKFTDTNGDKGNVGFDAIGGAAWRFDEMVDKISAQERPEEVTIAGFDHAVHAHIDTIDEYFLVSGPNYLSATIYGDVDQDAVLGAIAAKLDALAP